ncbi:MAG: hypothetical protein OHK0057_25590 [Thermoflexibacter sp.]
MRNKIQLVCIALFVMGIAFVAHAFTLYLKNESTKSKYEKTKAIVTEANTSSNHATYYPMLQFKTIDNQRVRIRASREKLGANVGDTIEIYYDIINPQSIYIPSKQESTLIIILFSFGLLITLPAVVFFRWQWLNNNKIKQIKVNGKKLVAVVTSIEELESPKILGIKPYRIHCIASNNTFNGTKKTFQSGYIWENPANYLRNNEINVFIDAIDKEKYVVDLSFLPNEVLFEY